MPDTESPDAPATIIRRSFHEPDEVIPFVHGRAVIVGIGDGGDVWRSELEPGWSFDEDLKPYAGGAKSCPMTHREYVVSGRIRYLMDDGSELVASAGDALFIPPGHRAWVWGTSAAC